MPVLSICIPTYNRSSILRDTLEKLCAEEAFAQTDEVEIVISDNCSPDDTAQVCAEFIQRYGDKIHYHRQPENIADKNFAAVLGMAHGEYAKLSNDTIFFRPGEMGKVVNFLKSGQAAEAVFFDNIPATDQQPCLCETFDELLARASYMLTWIGGYCVKTSAFCALEDPARYSHLYFSQVDIISRMMKAGCKTTFYPGQVMDASILQKKGGYSVPEVFGRCYMNIIDEIRAEGRISDSVYREHKKKLLFDHINKFTILQKDTTFSSRGYFRCLLPIYGKDAYFYTALVTGLLKRFVRGLFCIRNKGERKEVTLLFISFTFARRRKNKN